MDIKPLSKGTAGDKQFNVPEFLPRKHFSMCVVGKTDSGKTVLIQELINNIAFKTTLDKEDVNGISDGSTFRLFIVRLRNFTKTLMIQMPKIRVIMASNSFGAYSMTIVVPCCT